MKEMYEFRIDEKYAHRLFTPDEGRKLGPLVRKVILLPEDPRFERVGELQAEYCRGTEKPRFFFASAQIHRRYTRKELQAAELFQLMITAVFEPVGEECGTEYMEGSGCPECGSGKKQQGPLRLDLRKAPKTKDIARTLAHEWIVSQRLGELMIDHGLTGFELRRVWHKGYYEDDPYYFHETPAGRKIMELADEAGVVEGTWPYYVWLNRADVRPLVDLSRQEMVVMKRKRARRRGRPAPVWYQLVPTSRPVDVAPLTKTGVEPFDEDPENKYRCSRGDLIGLNLLSEVYLRNKDYDGADVAITRQFIGARGGIHRPTPVLLISPRFWRLLESEKVKGYKVEVAHLI
jgi:hypothetical protein